MEVPLNRTLIDIDDALPAFAQQRLDTGTKRDTINRARALHWLQANADGFLDFEVFEARELAGR
ncbi:DUF2191 domain-containing protein [Streptomyces bottropensis]|uniref:DUF2191 domain-containing protein n=1 Tax=Streptomyces bottropensis TaxID=42235 RepID=UPI0036B42E33